MNLSATELIAALNWRYATKKFDTTRKIPEEIWSAIEQSLVLAPSSFGLQPWKFLIIDSPTLRAKLLTDSWNQPQVVEASHFVVLAARTDLAQSDINAWIACLGEVRQQAPEENALYKGRISGFAETLSDEERHEWNVRQIYIALGQLLASAAVLGIDACPMEGISKTAYDRILGLENSGYSTVIACALGYRSPEDKYATTAKARFDLEKVVQHL